jgi:hypothetical protein
MNADNGRLGDPASQVRSALADRVMASGPVLPFPIGFAERILDIA